MRTGFLPALALIATTTAAAAEPLELTEGQMDQVTAGVGDVIIQIAIVNQISVPITTNTVTAIGLGSGNVSAQGSVTVISSNTAIISQQVLQPASLAQKPQCGAAGLSRAFRYPG